MLDGMEAPMQCPACTSEDQRVLDTTGASKMARLRCCNTCGYRWNTVELEAQHLARVESAVKAVRTFTTHSKEIADAEATHS